MRKVILILVLMIGHLCFGQIAELNRDNQSAISFLPGNGNSIFHISHGLNNDLNISEGINVGGGNIMTIKNIGLIGIGTTNPAYKLDVNGTGRFTSNLLIGDPNGARTEINTSTNHKIYAPTNIKTIDLDGNYQGGGFVGVYRADIFNNPVAMHARVDYNMQYLKVDKFTDNGVHADGAKLISILDTGDTEALTGLQLNTTNSAIVIGSWIGYEKNKGYGLINRYKTKFEKDLYITSGNVGIGTITPDAKLAVKGNIHTNEVKVDLLGAVVPDYVFYKDYDLKTLTEVENYITKKGHLPNIPSAKQMEKEGIMLKEMNLKFLEKIEELTLYTINQEKDINKLKKENQDLKRINSKLLELQKRLEKLESKK
ncbi:tail fiber protein [Flavivirga abyssicola]|uniref:tail fiber protein n=1 Tax=Flavivirga abyssicola TaxID=3063533 RepID=UPI0026DF121D|nr:tail fiber protein [Flavivirga sp. MEBiC07777]WVK14927.1 tail fiber protein [Flavivirga sp. MEBiC07777]